jgi:hypothetical protein
MKSSSRATNSIFPRKVSFTSPLVRPLRRILAIAIRELNERFGAPGHGATSNAHAYYDGDRVGGHRLS